MESEGSGAAPQDRTADLWFHHTTTFVATYLGVCALDFLFIIPTKVGLDAHRKVSTPSLSGLARDYHFTGFPEFDEFSLKGFPMRTQFKTTNAMLYQLS